MTNYNINNNYIAERSDKDAMKISVQTVLNLLHNIIQPISLDLVQHLQHTALICFYLGKSAGLSEADISNAYLAGMLHDIGALGNDRKDLTLGSETFLLGHEENGAAMAEGIRFLQPIVPVLRNHHTHEQGIGRHPLPLVNHLVHMADEFELFLRCHQGDLIVHHDKLIAEFLDSAPPRPAILVDALVKIGKEDGFWFRLESGSLPYVLDTISPLKHTYLDLDDFLEVCQLISRIVDKYSSFTRTHSASVASVAERLAELYGFSRDMQKKICIAGYLHDIGKLFIPLNILEKEGKLEPDEYALMKLHSYKTLVMLHPIAELGEIIHWAANHHERLDGSGYPFCLTGRDLDIPSRILAVADVFTAMTENRPYRRGMPIGKALQILQEESDNGRYDSDIVALLRHNVEMVNGLVAMC